MSERIDRYVLFTGEHYPDGGAEDLVRTSNDLKALCSDGEIGLESDGQLWNWWHVLDRQTNKIVEQGED